MTHIPEAQLALYAGGELEAPEASAITQHVEDCAECRRKVGEFRLTEAWLKGVAAEPDAGQLYTLRESVLHRIENRRSRKPLWWMAAAVALLAMVFFAARLFSPAPVPLSTATALPPLLPSRGSVTPLVLPSRVLPSRDREGAVRHAHPRLAHVAKSSEGMPVVRVRTSDPNVVILWVVGNGSEQEKEQ